MDEDNRAACVKDEEGLHGACNIMHMSMHMHMSV